MFEMCVDVAQLNVEKKGDISERFFWVEAGRGGDIPLLDCVCIISFDMTTPPSWRGKVIAYYYYTYVVTVTELAARQREPRPGLLNIVREYWQFLLLHLFRYDLTNKRYYTVITRLSRICLCI